MIDSEVFYGSMHRAQILLEPETYRRLKEKARLEKRSISDVTREVIKRGLALRDDTEEIWKKRAKALDSLRYEYSSVAPPQTEQDVRDLITFARASRNS